MQNLLAQVFQLGGPGRQQDDLRSTVERDARQGPASLTKMMTLYLTFEAIRNGQISLDQNVRVSRHAASMPPSKLYLKAGQKVSIRSLIRAAAIKSANDAAVALAEAIGGTEEAFAQMMTTDPTQVTA